MKQEMRQHVIISRLNHVEYKFYQHELYIYEDVREKQAMYLIDQVQNMQHNSHKVYMHKIKIKVASIVVFVIVCVFVNDGCFVFSLVFTVVLRCCLLVDACLRRITMKIEFFLIYYEAYTTDTCIKLYNKQHIFNFYTCKKLQYF